METFLDNPWLQKLKEFFPEQIFTGAPWFSDAAHLANAGLASVCLGPGSIDQAHTADEFIRIRDLEAGADWFSAFIDKLI
jgi:acetylornithine deacetylase